MTKRVYNFSAGPATLPLSVLEEAQAELLSYQGSGMSVLEMSHRSKWIGEVFENAEENLRTLLEIPKNYHVLFLQGGARLQFAMIPLNFLPEKASSDYILTGSWGKYAIEEAEQQGKVRLAWSGKEDNFIRVPQSNELDLDGEAAYVHFTSNETIQGVQFRTEPDVGDVPLICDMSSDFISRPLPVDRYAMIYAGAQKNAGPAGVTLVIIRDDMLERIPSGLPKMLDYRTHVEKRSLYNTPPVFAVYLVSLVTKWLRNEIGGLAAIDKRNQEKADRLYGIIDASEGYYRGHAHVESRSLMNVTWRLPNEELEKKFLSEATEAGLCELKGHRSVGGIRASIYNAMPREGVEALVSFMEAFRQANPV